MSDIGLSTSVAVGLVFLLAGANKVSASSGYERALAFAEVLLAVALICQVWTREIRLGACLLSGAYLI
jgi:hypothetical protein